MDLLIQAACASPSSKNRQNWKIMPVWKEDLRELTARFRESVSDSRKRGELPDDIYKGCIGTAAIMETVPLALFVFCKSEGPICAEMMSLGAMIENMCLQAEHMGLSTLWVCDILYADGTCEDYLRCEGLQAAILVGHGDDDSPRAKHKRPADILLNFGKVD